MPRTRLSAVGLSTIALVAAVALSSVATLAQAPGGGPRPVSPFGAKAPAAVAKDVAPTAPGDTAALQRRVEQLEEQLVDMQVLVGTLESLAKGTAGASAARGPGAPAPGAGMSAADSGRLDAIETQVRALAAQMDSLQDQMRSLAERGPAPGGGFGAVTVAPAAPKDELDRVFPAGPATSPPAAKTMAAAPPGFAADDNTPPQQLYERAYGFLLQKDYATAEANFDAFLKRNPTHQLAGSAQYWLGETFFVRGQYRTAATAFLKGYQDYGKSQKASESLLKLAMSLQRLGQKEAACSAFTEFATKYPSPPANIRTLAQTERQRAGC